MTLIISALPIEVAALRASLSKRWHEHRCGQTIECGEIADSTYALLCCGVALSRGADYVGSAIQSLGPERVINVGCAGSLVATVPYESLFIPSQHLIVNHNIYTRPSPRLHASIISCSATLGAYTVGSLISVAHAVLNPYERQRLRALYGAEAVDMEAAPLAEIAQRYTVPFASLKWISDTPYNSGAHTVRRAMGAGAVALASVIRLVNRRHT